MTATPEIDEIWYLALHCRMFLFAHNQLERLGLMDTGDASSDPIEANYHQFAAVQLLTTLCVVDKGKGSLHKGYIHHALTSVNHAGLVADVQAILDRPIYSDVTFGEALRSRRNYDRTHGNIYRPKRSISRANEKRALESYAATEIASGQDAFNECWLKMVAAIERLADALELEMERLAPPDPPEGAPLASEVLPRRAGAIGLHRIPRYIAFGLGQFGIAEVLDWRLKPRARAAPPELEG